MFFMILNYLELEFLRTAIWVKSLQFMKFEVTFCLKIEIMTEINWLKWKLAFSAVEWIIFFFGSA